MPSRSFSGESRSQLSDSGAAARSQPQARRQGGGRRGGRRRGARSQIDDLLGGDSEDRSAGGLGGAGGSGARGGFMGNDALEAVALKPARAPRDYRPYPEDEDMDGGCSKCIGCAYVSGGAGGDESARDAMAEIHELISKNHNARCSDGELVEMVFEFYEKEVRPWNDCGEWTKRSIYEHVYHHMNDPDVQTAGLAAMLFNQIQSLRDVCWQINPETGVYTPHTANLKLLADLIPKQQTLLDARKRRTAVGAGGDKR